MSDLFPFIATKTTVDVAVPTQAFNQQDYNRRVSNAFKAKQGGRLTVGDIKLRPTAGAVPNHLLCDGSAVSRAKFSELFRLIGETAGAGDGATTFNIPNYMGNALTVPATAPAQIISDSGTVSTDATVTTQPVGSGQVGHTHGSNVLSGGNKKKIGE